MLLSQLGELQRGVEAARKPPTAAVELLQTSLHYVDDYAGHVAVEDVEGSWSFLLVELYDDGGIRVSGPPDHDRRLVSSSELRDWVSAASDARASVTLIGRTAASLVAPIVADIAAMSSVGTGEFVDESPTRALKGGAILRIADRIRRPSSLALACRAGAVESVTDMLERGTDPEVGGRPFRWARRFGNVEAARVYQRFTGQSSPGAPTECPDAIVIRVLSRFARLSPWVVALVLGVGVLAATTRSPDVIVGFAILGPWGLIALIVMIGALLPGARVERLALDGSMLWYRRSFDRRWTGPFDLSRTAAVAGTFDRYIGSVTPNVTLIGAGLPQRQNGLPREVRRLIGERGRLTLSLPYVGWVDPPGGSIMTAIRAHLPGTVEYLPNSVEVLDFLALRDRARLLCD